MTGRWTRRDFLKESGLGAAALSLGAIGCERTSGNGAQTLGSLADEILRDGPPRKPKIAIIGGGPAGLSAAFHLTREPGWERRYDVTVYQLGFRLGGKGATGRNADAGWRIEEHGIHGFCRFYFNTWQMMKEVYGELHPDDRTLLPAQTLEEAFLPSSVSYSVEFRDRWFTTVDYMPSTDGSPWDDEKPELGFLALMKGVFAAARDRGRRDVGAPGNDPLPPSQDPAFAGELTDTTIVSLLGQVGELQETDPQLDRDDESLKPVLEQWIARLEALSDERSVMADEARDAGGLRSRFLTSVDFYLAVALGLARERMRALVQGRPWDLDDLDDLDYREWLRRNGASDHTLSSPISYSIANILFAFPEGDSTEPPRLSAASWLSWVARSFLGRGEYFYFLAAGTGETVVLPLYLLLKRRGVRFEFFHKLVGMRSGEGSDAEPVVDELLFEEQAEITGNVQYDPLEELPGKTYRVWPNRPRWKLLKGFQESSDLDFEAWTSKGGDQVVKTLRRGAEFDHVVWAMPPSMIPLLGDDVMRRTWARINDHLTTTATQAVQLWLTRDTADLGWSRSHLKPAGTARYASASFPNPLNGCVAFDDVLEFEAWPSGGPKGLVYLCSQLQELPGPLSREDEQIRIRSTLSSSLRLMGNFLSAGRAVAPELVDRQSLDFDLLYDPAPGHKGEERLMSQYVRANTRPTEAYVQAPPGGLQGRLDAWESGYANLVPAGDWIRTGFNLGSFESAVTGGKLAAFALAGTPSIDSVVGYRLWHARAGERIRRALLRGPRIPVS